jgi:hypothetical protein
MQPASVVDETFPREKQIEIIAGAKQGIGMFLRQDAVMGVMLPASLTKGKGLSTVIDQYFSQWTSPFAPAGGYFQLSVLRKSVDGFFTSLRDELDRLPTFTVTNKGNLAIQSLVTGASKQYPRATLEMLDDFIVGEIDHAGKCLAFELPTACGFHILRAVEISAKAYVHAATGKLPGIKNRNWGEYIFQLEQAKVHSDVTDLLKILKTKRNPLMHPQDSLDIDEAIGLICICQAGIETLVADVRRRSLEITFKESLRLLPTL